jgi:hypothetical protein
VRPGSHTKVSVPLVLQQNRHPACPGLPWERSASQTYCLTEDLRRGVEGPRGCLINPCSAGLSGHQNYEKIEKVTTSDRSVPGFPATRHSPAATCAAFSKESRMKFDNATNLNRKSGVAQWRICGFTSFPHTDT